MYRTGLGYDIHRFALGRKLMLGGVEIPYDRGLDGHSDADVLLHAVCDAILGAIGRGDIGEHFSNKDPRWKNISSLVLLDEVMKMSEKDGYTVGNLDVVVLAEEPSIKAYKSAMKETIAKRLKISADCVNIKATTQEQMGSIGRKEGIAAFATVLVFKK